VTQLSRKLSIGLAMVIAFFSLLPADTAISSGFGDKTEHFAAFALLAASSSHGWASRRWWQVGAICVLFGGAIEVAQAFSPGRFPDPLDWLADTVGVAIGIAAASLYRRSRSRS
jgi:VanZ family protein